MTWPTSLIVREKKLTFGRQYYIEDAQGKQYAYCKQKMFRLKEDVQFFSDESQSQLVMRMKASKMFDFNANLEVTDGSGKVLAYFQRDGWSSLIRDRWRVANPDGSPLGQMTEDSLMMALLRRFFSAWIPYKYDVVGPDGQKLVHVEEKLQLFGDTYRVNVLGPIDPRLAAALAVIADAFEDQ